MILSMKAKILGKLVFVLAQFLIGKFLERSAAGADHEPMAPFFTLNGTLNKPAAGQNPMTQIEAAKQIEYAIDSNVI